MEGLQHNATPYLYPVLMKRWFFSGGESSRSGPVSAQEFQSQNSLNHKEDVREVIFGFNRVLCHYVRYLYIMCVNLLCILTAWRHPFSWGNSFSTLDSTLHPVHQVLLNPGLLSWEPIKNSKVRNYKHLVWVWTNVQGAVFLLSAKTRQIINIFF